MFPQLQGYPIERVPVRTIRREPKARTGRPLDTIIRLFRRA